MILAEKTMNQATIAYHIRAFFGMAGMNPTCPVMAAKNVCLGGWKSNLAERQAILSAVYHWVTKSNSVSCRPNNRMQMGSDTEDDLQPEYDLKNLQVRKVGYPRTGFGGYVQLAPDVAVLFPDAKAVNEALRFLIRITRRSKMLPQNLGTAG